MTDLNFSSVIKTLKNGMYTVTNMPTPTIHRLLGACNGNYLRQELPEFPGPMLVGDKPVAVLSNQAYPCVFIILFASRTSVTTNTF